MSKISGTDAVVPIVIKVVNPFSDECMIIVIQNDYATATFLVLKIRILDQKPLVGKSVTCIPLFIIALRTVEEEHTTIL